MYPKEYIQYLAHFHGDRDYFECHEILEEYWKMATNRKKDSIWVGFILLAVSTYHHRRANFEGAKRTLEKAIKIFRLQENCLENLGIDIQNLYVLLNRQLACIENNELYHSFNLPISDTILIMECQKVCQQIEAVWGHTSNVEDVNLVHRHKLRDRTGVIQERLYALEHKKGNE